MTVVKDGNGLAIPIGAAAFVIVALLETISYLAWTTTNANIERIEKQASARLQAAEHLSLERLQLVEKEFLRLREHDEFTRRLDAQISKIEAKLAATATREELDQRLGINSGSVIQVRTQIDELKRDLGQTYPLKEVLGNLNARLDRMETWSRSPPPFQMPPAKQP